MNGMSHEDILREIELNDAPVEEPTMEKTASASLVDEIRSYTATGITKEASASSASLLDVIHGLEKSARISSPYAEEFIKRAQAAGASDEQIVSILEQKHEELIEKAAQGFLGGIKHMLKNMTPRWASKNRATGAAFGKGLEYLQNTANKQQQALGAVLSSLDDAALSVKHVKKPGFFEKLNPAFDFQRYQGAQIDAASSKLYKKLLAAERAGVDKGMLFDVYSRLGGGTKGAIKRIRHPELKAWMKEMDALVKAEEAALKGAQSGMLGGLPEAGKKFAKKHPVTTAGLVGAGGYAAGDWGDDGGSGGKVVVVP